MRILLGQKDLVVGMSDVDLNHPTLLTARCPFTAIGLVCLPSVSAHLSKTGHD